MYWKRSTFRVLLLLSLFLLPLQISSLSANSVKDIEGGDFTLQSKMGPVTLSELRGKVVLLFFGYTSCPNVCPVSLNTMTLTFNKMTPLELDGVQALFISLDPDRDTLEMLKTYVEYFHPKILGVTDNMEQVKKVTRQYGVKWLRKELTRSALGYSIAHTSDIYILNKNGQFHETVSHIMDPEMLYQNLKALMASTPVQN